MIYLKTDLHQKRIIIEDSVVDLNNELGHFLGFLPALRDADLRVGALGDCPFLFQILDGNFD